MSLYDKIEARSEEICFQYPVETAVIAWLLDTGAASPKVAWDFLEDVDDDA